MIKFGINQLYFTAVIHARNQEIYWTSEIQQGQPTKEVSPLDPCLQTKITP